MVRNLRVAVVGLGKMGMLHAGILNVLQSVELVSLCEKSSIIRRILKKVFKSAYIVDDIEKLSRLNLDAVYVTTPITSHFSIIKDVCLKKIAPNIFVEKTLASSYVEAKELCELADKYSCLTMVGYQRRFSVIFAKAKNLLEQRVIGKPASFEAYAYSSDFLGSEGNIKVHASRISAIRDIGCHAIDVVLWFFSDMQVKSAKLGSPSSDYSESFVYFECQKSDSMGGRLNISQSMEQYRMPEVGMQVNGSLGTLKVNDDKLNISLKDGESFTWYRHDLQDYVEFLLGTPEYFREDEYFTRSILQENITEPSFNTASKVDYIIDHIKGKL